MLTWQPLGLLTTVKPPALRERPDVCQAYLCTWRVKVPSANLMEVKASEAQGRHREVGSEGSVE
jgi:hypothetical protein